jgi:hypothetical protein
MQLMTLLNSASLGTLGQEIKHNHFINSIPDSIPYTTNTPHYPVLFGFKTEPKLPALPTSLTVI